MVNQSIIDDLVSVEYDHDNVDYRVVKVLFIQEYIQKHQSFNACLVLLDLDTFVAKEATTDDLFAMMTNTYDLMATREVAASFNEHADVPSRLIYRQFNTGVVGMRLTKRIRLFVSEWLRLFALKPTVPGTDQYEFTRLAFLLGVPVYVLPDNWNCRCETDQLQVGFVPWLPWARPSSLKYSEDGKGRVLSEIEQCLIVHCHRVGLMMQRQRTLDELIANLKK